MPFKASDWKDTKKKAQKGKFPHSREQRVGCWLEAADKKQAFDDSRLALQKDNPTAPPNGVSLARASKFRGGDLSTVLYLYEEDAPQRLLSA